MNLRNTILTLLILVIATVVAAAQVDEGGEIESVEIEIVKERQITLPRANRNFNKIPPRPAERLQSSMTYDLRPLRFDAPEFKATVKPLRVKQEEMSKIYAGYVTGGFGNYASPHLAASFTSKRDEKRYFGGDFYHRSFGTGPVDGKNSAGGDTRVNLFAAGLGPTVTGRINASYEYRYNHFYGKGATTQEVLNRSTILQRYNIAGIQAVLENTKPTDFNFRLNGDFSFLADNFNASESMALLSFQSDYEMDKNRGILFRMNYALVARKDQFAEAKPRHLLKVAPGYRMTLSEKIALTIGLNTAIENDTIGSSKFHLYPDVWISYPATRNVEVYSGLTGDMDRVSLHSLAGINPWVGPNIAIAHTNRSIDFQLGARGKLTKSLSFNAGAAVTRLKHLYFFQNMVTDPAKFNVIYDDALRLNFFAEAGISTAEKVQVNLRGDYFSYAMNVFDHAWHRPQYKVGIYSSFKAAGKLMINLNLITQGGMKAYDNELNSVVDLQAAVDVSAKLRYFFSKRFSIYVEGNNLLNRSYPLYLHYPVRGVQVSGGLSWSF